MRHHYIRVIALFFALILYLPSFAAAEDRVFDTAASIKPIHSILAFVVKGTREPSLIVDGAASAHHFHMRPSDARALRRAALFVWIGPGLESYLQKPVSALPKSVRVLTLSKLDGLVRLRNRERGGHAAHSHDHHDHGGAHHSEDQHYWLDPKNAVLFAKAIASEMARLDVGNAGLYRKNAELFADKAVKLMKNIAADTGKVRNRKYVVFHDAYQYFERRFGIDTGRAIALSPDLPPGARQVSETADWISRNGVGCIFSEPQFSPKLVRALAKKTGARTGVLDPLGAELMPGAQLYFTLLSKIAEAFVNCQKN